MVSDSHRDVRKKMCVCACVGIHTNILGFLLKTPVLSSTESVPRERSPEETDALLSQAQSSDKLLLQNPQSG